MKTTKINHLFIPMLALSVSVGMMSCSKLDETVYGTVSIAPTVTGAATPGSLSGVYNQLNGLATDQGDWYGMNEHSTDEMMGPTRGTDWDDFGTWRRLHLHTWDGTHNQVVNTWNILNGGAFQATLLAETATGQTKAEAQFLRAFFATQVVDLYGQLPYRAATDGPDVIPVVKSRADATNFILSDLDAAIGVLPSYTKSTRDKATKEAAQFLEARVYLNKAVYTNDPTKPAGPYTFAAADMNKVISLCDAIASNPAFAISPNYFDNFKWDNGSTSSELIFTRTNADGINVQWQTYMAFHYNQAPSGWNGFTTLSDFYNSFGPGDTRVGGTNAVPSYSSQMGSPVGFIVGQVKGPQNGVVGNPIVNIKDRSGNPLIFTPDASLFFSTEAKGIRVVKYPLDPSTINSGASASKNDFVFFRFADARLMKAEAILRGGTPTGGETALSIVNGIRAIRGASALTSVDLPTLLAERGRELYYEAVRRDDMIRFGVFNAPVGERPVASDASRCLYPIPTIALSSNPNLKQNWGY
jgi:hypothetical protein